MKRLVRISANWWAVATVVLLWQLAVTILRVDPILLPPPSTIVVDVAANPGTFLLPLAFTVGTAAIGFTIGVATGYAAASVTWMWPVLNASLTPLALVIRSVPFVALVPVLTQLFGFSTATALIICAMVSFFPTFVLVTTGLGEIPANSAELFSSLGTSRVNRFRYLAIPASMPALGVAVRISAASSISAALVAEFLMGTPGLAHVLSTALETLDMSTVWGSSLCLIVTAVAAYLLANVLERHLVAKFR